MNVMLTIIIFCLLLIPSTAYTEEHLELMGTGEVRYMGFIKVYKAQLYTHQTGKDVDILDAGVSKCLNLSYFVSLTPENFIQAANTVLHNQYPASHIQSLADKLNQLNAAYQQVEEGDQYRLCYDAAQTTTRLLLNDVELTAINSPTFAKTYFGIWLGPKSPIDEKLRESLLAGYTEGVQHE